MSTGVSTAQKDNNLHKIKNACFIFKSKPFLLFNIILLLSLQFNANCPLCRRAVTPQ